MKRKLFIFCIPLLLFFAFAFQGERGIFESTEGRYANVAYIMLKSGDWLHPMLNFEQSHWTKPPMYYWTVVASMKVFGQNTFAVRFPGALAFFLSILLVFQLGKIFSPKRPWLPSLIYASSLMPLAASNAISTDGLLALFETAGMTCFTLLFFTPLSRNKQFLISLAGSISWALAFLTKGPPALLPITGLLLFLALNRNALKSIRIRNLFGGIFIFILLASSWFILILRENPDLLSYFLREEVVNRIASTKFNRNPGFWGGFITYLPALLIGSLPWSIYLFRGLSQSIKNNSINLKKRKYPLDLKSLFILSWIIVPLVIFFLAKSRLPLYILPLFVPLALITATKIPEDLFERKSIRILFPLWVILFLFLRGISGYFYFPQDSKHLAKKLKNLCPKNCSEILFVDTKPQYGLSIYLDIPIEKISFLEKNDSYFKDETILEELELEEPGRLWLVSKNKKKKFTDFLIKKNIHPNFIQWVKGRKSYAVFTISD